MLQYEEMSKARAKEVKQSIVTLSNTNLDDFTWRLAAHSSLIDAQPWQLQMLSDKTISLPNYQTKKTISLCWRGWLGQFPFWAINFTGIWSNDVSVTWSPGTTSSCTDLVAERVGTLVHVNNFKTFTWPTPIEISLGISPTGRLLGQTDTDVSWCQTLLSQKHSYN